MSDPAIRYARKIHDAYQVLIRQGWREIQYCPKDGTHFECIEAGSVGIHDCTYEGEWPDGGWFVHTEDDSYPSYPILWRSKERAG